MVKVFLLFSVLFLKFTLFGELDQDNAMHIKIFLQMTEHFQNTLPHSNQDAERFTSVAHWSFPASFARTCLLYIYIGWTEGRLCSWKKGVCRITDLICNWREKHLIEGMAYLLFAENLGEISLFGKSGN